MHTVEDFLQDKCGSLWCKARTVEDFLQDTCVSLKCEARTVGKFLQGVANPAEGRRHPLKAWFSIHAHPSVGVILGLVVVSVRIKRQAGIVQPIQAACAL